MENFSKYLIYKSIILKLGEEKYFNDCSVKLNHFGIKMYKSYGFFNTYLIYSDIQCKNFSLKIIILIKQKKYQILVLEISNSCFYYK